MLFTVGEAARAIQGTLLQGNPEAGVTGVSVDSRRLRPGELFFALRGQRDDGHRYIEEARARGAAGAVVARPPGEGYGPLPEDFPLVQVPDTLAALGQLAAYYRSRFRAPAVGITGSVGKTTTKEMVAAVLGTRLRVLKSPGNYNNEVGLPLAVFAWRPEHAVAVFELAMRGRGQIAALCRIVQPQVGVVTNVGESHLELLGSIEAIAEAKAELVEALPPHGVAVLNADDPRVRAMADRTRARVIFYGLYAPADVRAEEVRPDGPFAMRGYLVTRRGRVPLRLPVPGLHQVQNALAAAAVGLVFGLPLRAITEGLESFQPAEGRLRVLNLGELTVLDDSYNAAPASTVAALQALRQAAGEGRAVAILGDMWELGPAEEEGHRRVGACAARAADVLLAVGPRMRWAVQAAHQAGMPEEDCRHFETLEELLHQLPGWLRPGDTVLVKGSRGMGMERVVRALEEGAVWESAGGRPQASAAEA